MSTLLIDISAPGLDVFALLSRVAYAVLSPVARERTIPDCDGNHERLTPCVLPGGRYSQSGLTLWLVQGRRDSLLQHFDLHVAGTEQ